MTVVTRPHAQARRWHCRRAPTLPIRPATPRAQRRDCQGQLIAALEAMLAPARVQDAQMSPWCSATFVGTRHAITLGLAGEDAVEEARRLTNGLGEAAFALRGHIVVDLAIDDISGAPVLGKALIRLAVLTIEEW